MSNILVLLIGIGLIAVSGLPVGIWRRRWAQVMSVLVFSVGSLAGLAGAFSALWSPEVSSLEFTWALPWGHFAVAVDSLSAFFLVLVFSVPALGAIYSLGYWDQREHPDNGGRLGVFYGFLVAGMALVLIARDAALFLIVWEIMAVSAYFTASVEDEKLEVRNAGLVYLVATHMGTLVLMAMFGLWIYASGSTALTATATIPLEMAGLIFALAFFGFGFKAGFMPLHVWLPEAHANAPSHVSAVMSGVMLKMGIYGILRMLSLLTVSDSWWGILVLVVGSITAILGIAFALGQRDLKKVLAYSSIENIGIILLGIGLALLGKFYQLPALVLLGLGGALFHVWNHGILKSLLFLTSGSIIHGTHTRDMESLGGLAKRMPRTSLLFVIGAVAICALPPLNGFAGEWLLYLGLFTTMTSQVSQAGPDLMLAGFTAVVLAMTGALAVAAFVRLFSTVFLGAPRTDRVAHAHDSGPSMNGPMKLLAIAALLLGIVPFGVNPLLERAIQAWDPHRSYIDGLSSLVDQSWFPIMGAAILGLIGLGCIWYRLSLRNRLPQEERLTWDCGYAKPTERMQYTGTSFAQTLVRIFSFTLVPQRNHIRIRKIFPGPERFVMKLPDLVLDRWILPLFAWIAAKCKRAYKLQQGQTYLYVLYIVIITLFLFIVSTFGGSL